MRRTFFDHKIVMLHDFKQVNLELAKRFGWEVDYTRRMFYYEGKEYFLPIHSDWNSIALMLHCMDKVDRGKWKKSYHILQLVGKYMSMNNKLSIYFILLFAFDDKLYEKVSKYNYYMETLDGFLKELDVVGYKYDKWGTVMDIWFNVCDHLYDRGDDIPAEWLFKPSPMAVQGESVQTESYWFELFVTAPSELLVEIGNWCMEEAKKLEEQGLSY